MGRFLLILLALGASAHAAPGRLYLTEFGRRILVKTDQIVEARVAAVQPAFRGITTARLSVSERLEGFDEGREIVLMYVDDLTAPDAFGSTLERSSVHYERRRKAGLKKYLGDLSSGRLPKAEQEIGARKTRQSTERDATTGPIRRVGVRLAKGEEGMFFLKRRGATYTLIGLVPRRDPLYEQKRERLREVLRIEAILAFEARATHAKRFYMRALDETDPWLRGNAAREIVSLSLRYSTFFRRAEIARLSELLFKEREPPIQALLERAVRALDPKAGMAYAVKAEQRERERFEHALRTERERLDAIKIPDLRAADLARAGQRYGRAATVLLSVYLTDKSPLVRERAAHSLAEHGGPSCRAALREALERETDRQAASALIYACGVKSDPDAVALLEKRLAEPALSRLATHALARIGTPSARKALERHRARVDEATAETIDAILREEFSKDS